MSEIKFNDGMPVRERRSSTSIYPEEFLDKKVFSKYEISTVEPDINDVNGFEKYITLYKKSLAVEKSAVENI